MNDETLRDLIGTLKSFAEIIENLRQDIEATIKDCTELLDKQNS